MTVREKLVGLLIEADREIGILCDGCGSRPEQEVFGNIADHLIAHGVTVREMKKPLTVENLIFFNWEIWREWWIELKSGRLFCAKECIGYIHTPKDEYGKTWRCWAEKPRSEERKAAEWER